MRSTLLVATFIVCTGCASNPNKIDAAYVSPLTYARYNCDQIASEMNYVGQETTKLYQRLKSERTADNWQMAAGLLVFWPALLFLEGGDGPEAGRYSQLKGEFEALRQASIEKGCTINALSPEEIIKRESSDQNEGDERMTTASSDEESQVGGPSLSSQTFEARKMAIADGCTGIPEKVREAEDGNVFAVACDNGDGVFVRCVGSDCSLMK